VGIYVFAMQLLVECVKLKRVNCRNCSCKICVNG
jgi:hypothetical protein